MGKWFEKHDRCSRWQDWLDGRTINGAPGRNLQEWLAGISPLDREHFLGCDDCRAATEAWLRVRGSLLDRPKVAASPSPWFPARVMTAIAAKEEEMRPAAAWIAVPRFASRLVWAAAALLVVASTWVYQKPPVRISRPPAMNASEGIFDAQSPPVTEDEVLVSLAEKDHE